MQDRTNTRAKKIETRAASFLDMWRRFPDERGPLSHAAKLLHDALAIPADPGPDKPTPPESLVERPDMAMDLNTPQPAPKNTGERIAPLVETDLRSRIEVGKATYGEELRAFNGRDALRDAYEEVLDAALYLRQAIYRRDGQ